MQDRLVRFQLFGQEYTFYSDAPEEEVESVIALLRQELEASEKVSRSAVPSSKMLILGCLRMAAKYTQLNRECNDLRLERERRVAQLIAKVSAELD